MAKHEPTKPKPDPLAMNFQMEGTTIVAAIPSDMLIQPDHVARVFDQVDRAIDQAPAGTSLLLSFAKVRYMSSIVLGRLIALSRKLAKQNGRLMVCELNADLADVMKHAKLDKFIAIYPTASAALEGRVFSWAKLLGRKRDGE